MQEIIEKATEYGIELNDNIIIKRQQFRDGKKKFFINDEPVTQKLISNLSNMLLEMHGQHGYSILLSPPQHQKILDKFGNLDHDRQIIEQKFSEIQKLSSDLEKINQY
ncbi:MAG UNVERIFIED_CONTAM: hypothetical protein LVQ98_00580 [Rickettsiaceae bacterium]|jgi:DNA repair protein RecN (Recombination protein N)